MKLYRLLPILGLCAQTLSAQINDLTRSTPEAEGISSSHVLAFMDSVMNFPGTEMHNVIVMRHGKIIAEKQAQPFAPQYGHQLFSCSKTFTSAAVGIAIADNRLRLSDRLCAIFPEFMPKSVDSLLANITVHDLLTMTSGFEVNTRIRQVEQEWIRCYMQHPMVAKPGTRFAYDSMDTYLLSAIVQRVTGKKVIDLLKERIFGPMHIIDVAWEESPEGINGGGWGLYLQAESMAKMGQLLLQHGQWDGVQLLPANWVEEMGRKQVDNPHGDDYCYQMWRCAYPTAFRADGAYGQYIIVIPDKDMVVVMTQCMLEGGSKLQKYIWDCLLPYVQDQPLPESKATHKLAQKSYTLPLPRGKRQSKVSSLFNGKEIQLDDNPMFWRSMTFHLDQGKAWLHVKTLDSKESDLPLGFGQWLTDSISIEPLNSRKSTLGSFSNVPRPFFASGAYACQGDHLVLAIHFVNWMSGITLEFCADGSIVAHINYEKTPIKLCSSAIK